MLPSFGLSAPQTGIKSAIINHVRTLYQTTVIQMIRLCLRIVGFLRGSEKAFDPGEHAFHKGVGNGGRILILDKRFQK